MGGTVSIANGIGVTGTITAKSLDQACDRHSPRRGRDHAGTAQCRKNHCHQWQHRRSRSRRRSTLRRAPTCRSSATAGRSSASDRRQRHGRRHHRQIRHAGPDRKQRNHLRPAAQRRTRTATSRSTSAPIPAGATIKQTARRGHFRRTVDHRRRQVRDRQRHVRCCRRKADRQCQLRRRRQQVPAVRRRDGERQADASGAGADTLTTGGTRVFNGTVDFGGGADTLTIGGTSSFTGAAEQCHRPGGQRPEGHLRRRQDRRHIASLDVTDGGTLAVTLDKTPGASSMLNVSGTASFADRVQAAAQCCQCRPGRRTLRRHQRRNVDRRQQPHDNDRPPALPLQGVADASPATRLRSISLANRDRARPQPIGKRGLSAQSMRRSPPTMISATASSPSATRKSSSAPSARCCPSMRAARSKR